MIITPEILRVLPSWKFV